MGKEEVNRALMNEIAQLSRLIVEKSKNPGAGAARKFPGTGTHYKYKPHLAYHHSATVQGSFHSKYSNQNDLGLSQSTYRTSNSKYTYNAPSKPNNGLKTTNSTLTEDSAKVAENILPNQESSGGGFVLASTLINPNVSRKTVAAEPKSGQNNGWSSKSRYRLDRRLKVKSGVVEQPEVAVGVESSCRRSIAHAPATYRPLPSVKYSKSKYSYRKALSPKSSPSKSPLRKRNVQPHTASASNLVYIRGLKYVSNNSGKTLKRIRTGSVTTSSQTPTSPAKRIANRVLQKCMKIGQKRNVACIFFARFGSCKRQETDSCPFVHLSGRPRKLSFSSLMLGTARPCRFYNLGRCSRDDCPYMHVKAKSGLSPRRRPLRTTPTLTPSSSQESVSSCKRLKSSPKQKARKLVARYYNSGPVAALGSEVKPSGASEFSPITQTSDRESDSEFSDSDSGSGSEDEENAKSSEDENRDLSEINENNECSEPNVELKVHNAECDVPLESVKVPVLETVSCAGSSSAAQDSRRQRLLSKVASLKQRLGYTVAPSRPSRNPNAKPMPDFLSF